MTHDEGPRVGPEPEGASTAYAPELGPRLLFFSGGTALRDLSRHLVSRTHNSVHLITPFDSGGSSAALRHAFGMPAVGDLRNRLLALADQTVFGHPEACHLLAFRFPLDATPDALDRWLTRMVDGDDALVAATPPRMRQVIQRELATFQAARPEDMDLRGANVGNLFLAGAYLRTGRRLGEALSLLAHLVEARGIVRPVVDDNLHLRARLEDGTEVVGQHRLTRRQGPPLPPVAGLDLVDADDPRSPATPRVSPDVARLIASAEVICFPMGSFYTSLVATLLPGGVAPAIAVSGAPKVYVPNPGPDPEEAGMSLVEKVDVLLGYLRAGAGPGTPAASLLTHVLVDAAGAGLEPDQLAALAARGLEVLDTPLVDPGAPHRMDPTLLGEALLALRP